MPVGPVVADVVVVAGADVDRLVGAVADVRRAFAAHDLPLRSSVRALSGVTLVGAASKLYVFVADPRSGVDSSPRTGTAYERRLGNVLVHYGGGDRRVLAHVKAAVAALVS